MTSSHIAMMLRRTHLGARDGISHGNREGYAMIPRRGSVALRWLALIVVFASSTRALAERTEERPRELMNVGIRPQFDAQIPLDLPFTDSTGKPIKLAEIFDGTKPVVLTMNYSNCPMLCSLQLNGLITAMEKMKWTAGEEFRVVTVSIDPLETPERAQLTKQKYLQAYGRATDVTAWRFLVSAKEQNIRTLANVVGFDYSYSPERREYLHAAALILCTPDGHVARYLGGVEYNAETLRLSLYEAGQGKVGSVWDEVLMFCYQYDGRSGSYSMAAMRLMQAGGVTMIGVLGTVMFFFWRRELRRREPTPAQSTA